MKKERKEGKMKTFESWLVGFAPLKRPHQVILIQFVLKLWMKWLNIRQEGNETHECWQIQLKEMKHQKNEWVNREWMRKWMNIGISERVNEWENEWKSERMRKWVRLRPIEWLSEWVWEWLSMGLGMNNRMSFWMNEWGREF